MTKTMTARQHADRRAWYQSACAAAAAAAHRSMMASTAALHLYYGRGRIECAPGAPAGLASAWTQHVPRHFGRDQLTAWIVERCARLECLPAEV